MLNTFIVHNQQNDEKHTDNFAKETRECKNKQEIAETAKTNGPTCDNTCILKI